MPIVRSALEVHVQRLVQRWKYYPETVSLPLAKDELVISKLLTQTVATPGPINAREPIRSLTHHCGNHDTARLMLMSLVDVVTHRSIGEGHEHRWNKDVYKHMFNSCAASFHFPTRLCS